MRPTTLSRRRRSVKKARPPKVRLLAELLEDRTLLSSGQGLVQFDGTPYLPPTHMLLNPSGLLSGPTEGQPLDIALGYLNAHAADLGLTPADLQSPEVTNQYTDADTSITHIYLRQTVNDLE